MTQPPASADELRAILDEVDDLVIERIVATGATVDEIGEALRDVEDERGFGEEPHVPSSARVAEVRQILIDVLAAEGGDDLEPPPVVAETAERHPI